jgi:hypothetical protein
MVDLLGARGGLRGSASRVFGCNNDFLLSHGLILIVFE